MPRYRVTHTTTYRHRPHASAAWQSVHLQPRHEPAQHCDNFELEIAPHPADLASRLDYFGNKEHFFTLLAPLTELSITSRCVIRREDPAVPMPGLTPPLAEARPQVERLATGEQFALEQFRHASPLAPLLPAAAALADEFALDESAPALTWLAALGERFRATFTYDPEATNISTPLAEVLTHRHGVCQDFAHALVSCVRQHGLPAAYVSGYLLTNPPPGQPRLRGADAMHAWISVFIPGTGWIDYDPTNACFAGPAHIVVARGRDYADVSPVKGVFRGGMHTLTTAVTVEPADEEVG